MRYFKATICILLLITTAVHAQQQKGRLSGLITDRHTLQPLAGANIVIEGTSTGTTTDAEGHFSLSGLTAGSINISFFYLGYQTVLKSNVVINPGQATRLKIEMEADILEGETIEASASYFENPKEAPVSRRSMDFEEIRRSPGGLLDVQKVMQALPAVVSGSDQTNEIITRGGNPGENLFVMDGMEIPNPNHFAVIGTGGGPINMINTLMVRKVQFYAGGFSAKYGDKASSVMDISLRDGSREGFEAKASMAMSGIGLSAEGPIADGRGSYIVAGQKSYLDLIGSSMGITAVPQYYSLQSKLTYDLSATNTLKANLLYGADAIEIVDEGKGGYSRGAENVKTDSYQVTTGIGLRTIYTPALFSEHTLYYNRSYWFFDVYHTEDRETYAKNNLYQNQLGAKSDFVWQLPGHQELSWGLFAKRIDFDENTFIAPDTTFIYDRSGSDPDSISGIKYTNGEVRKDQFNVLYKSGAYLQLTGPLAGKLSYSAGLRYAYSAYNDFHAVSPRAALIWHFNNQRQLSLAYGRHYQTPHLFELTLAKGNKHLKNKYSDHLILGYEQLFASDIRFTTEIYYKNMTDISVLRQLVEENPFETASSEMMNSGQGYAYGLEVFLQKKLTRNFSGILSYSWSSARQRLARDKSWFNSDYDYRHVFTAIGGYKIRYYQKSWFKDVKRRWWYKAFNWILPLADEVEWSLKFRYLGGRPYTPPVYHPEWHKWIKEEGQARNTVRYPAYHRLDLRLDKRFFFNNWNFVLYFDVSNLYNRENIWEYQYNDDGTREKILQYQTLPVGGFIIEF